MSDIAKDAKLHSRDQSDPSRDRKGAVLPPFITACVITLCIIACALTFLLPADSLVVDLVYQGF